MKQLTKVIMLFVVNVVMMSLVAACSSGPGSNELETQVKPTLVSPYYDVISIKKLDCKKDAKSDTERYILSFEAGLKFKRSYDEMYKELAERKAKRHTETMGNLFSTDYSAKARQKSLESMKAGIDDLNAQTDLSILKSEFGEFKAGEIQKMKNSCRFVKADKSWRLVK